jgi:hypothetical protein
MSSEEASRRLREEVEDLRRQVEELADRVGRLEEAHLAGGAAGAARSRHTERAGAFGPDVIHPDATHHRTAVNRALEMLGVLPEEPAGAPITRHGAPVETLAKLRAHAGEGESESAAATAVAEEIVPLPELQCAEANAGSAAPEEPPPVDMEGALPVDLTRPWRNGRTRGLGLLLLETALVGVVLAALPGPKGVLAALPVPLLLAMPWRGAHGSTLLAHARFLTLVLMVRCLFPDVLGAADLRTEAMLATLLPAALLLRTSRGGARALALVASIVAGAAVWAETGWVIATGAAGLTVCVLALLLRRRPAEE